MDRIFHITPSSKKEELSTKDFNYYPEQYKHDGFIHCSFSHQISGVLDRHFEGQDDLVLLEIDREKLESETKIENTSGGEELFPHIYGAIPTNSIKNTFSLKRDKEGRFEIPKELQ